MEGTKCAHIGCNCHDFLPFSCPLCVQSFCLEHRSRFSHNPCAVANLTLPAESFSAEVTAAAAKEAQDLIKSVESRFDSISDPSSTTHSINVRTAQIPNGLISNDKSIATLDKLRDIENKSSSSAERKISCKTRMILIKSKSIGNSSIPASDRIYFSGRFIADSNKGKSDASVNDQVNFFYKRSMTLGEMLHQLGMTFPQLSYGCAVAPTGMSLVLSTDDTPDWKQWDRSKPLEILLESFEEVFIDIASTTDVVAAQKILELKRIEDYENALIAAETAIQAAKLAANVGNDDELVTYPLTVGEVVEYYPSSGSSSSRDSVGGATGMELVTIVGVHQDDFPNYYYTVRFNATKREKQTDRCVFGSVFLCRKFYSLKSFVVTK